MRRSIPIVALALALATALGGGAPLSAAPARDSVNLHLVAYSTPQAAYAALTSAFQKTKAGKGVTFSQSFGASGDQSRAVANGLPADIVAFSLSPDIDRLVQAKLVSKNWNKNSYHGSVTDSIVVFTVRKGNPKHIRTWNDLIKSGIKVITPNPFTSGGARWNIMAAYGAQLFQMHKTQTQALTYLNRLFAHVAVQDTSGSKSMQTFLGGEGDVAITYENEAIAAQQAGAKVDYVVPNGTILIENPIAVTSGTKYPKQANAFVKYLYSSAGQKIFGQKGYRPVVKSVFKTFHYTVPKSLFTIRKLGGWTQVTKKFFDPETGLVTQIERGHGVSP